MTRNMKLRWLPRQNQICYHILENLSHPTQAVLIPVLDSSGPWFAATYTEFFATYHGEVSYPSQWDHGQDRLYRLVLDLGIEPFLC